MESERRITELPLGTTVKKYQEAVLRKFASKASMSMAIPIGCGKSIIVIQAIQSTAAIREKSINVLIICNPMFKANWINEFDKLGNGLCVVKNLCGNKTARLNKLAMYTSTSDVNVFLISELAVHASLNHLRVTQWDFIIWDRPGHLLRTRAEGTEGARNSQYIRAIEKLRVKTSKFIVICEDPIPSPHLTIRTATIDSLLNKTPNYRRSHS
jgi:hypothetical protein